MEKVNKSGQIKYKIAERHKRREKNLKPGWENLGPHCLCSNTVSLNVLTPHWGALGCPYWAGFLITVTQSLTRSNSRKKGL